MPTIVVPSDWRHQQSRKAHDLVIKVVSKEDRGGIDYYITDDGKAFLADTLWENWEPLDPDGALKAWCDKHGYRWAPEGT